MLILKNPTKKILEFKVNNYVTKRLEEKNTVIYVTGERFRQCKYLLLNIPVEKVSTLDEIGSIDEVAEKDDNQIGKYRISILPET